MPQQHIWICSDNNALCHHSPLFTTALPVCPPACPSACPARLPACLPALPLPQWYAEAEKTNGRWAMAAVAGILFTEVLGKGKWYEVSA